MNAALLVLGIMGMDVSSTVLPNGLQVFTARDDTAPVVTICVAVKTGATCETALTNGLAHFYEHMFFKGNSALPDQTAYNERLRTLGIVRNGTTSDEVVRYYITLESALFREGMEFMRDAMVTPLFDQVEMERERAVITDEYLRNASSPWWGYWKAVENTVYPEPWRGNTIGNLEVIQSASPEVMRMFQEKYYTADNSALFILGDIDEETAVSEAARVFGSWRSGGSSDYDALGIAIRIDRDTTVRVQGPGGVGQIRIMMMGPTIAGYRSATYAGDVWGGYLSLASRRFQRNLVTDGPFSQVYGSYYTQRFSPAVTFGGTIAPERLEEGLELMNAEIEAMTVPGYFDEEGLAMARELLSRDRRLSRESSRELAIETLPFWWVQGNGLEYYQTYEDSIAVTGHARVVEFVERYVTGAPRAVFLVTPERGAL
ncbi:MAG: pitrilysin family protein [Candidatus Fermentibacteraceae bacterium]